MTRNSLRLALTYLAIIMLMSIGFSIVFYKTSTHELGRQAPPNIGMQTNVQFDDQHQLPSDNVQQFLDRRAAQGRHELFIRLLIVNGVALAAGGALSYYLARRTLRPIESAMEAQSRFVSDASHELRTPLTAIQASNEVALRNPRLTLKTAKEVIASNSLDAERLRELSEGLLNLANHDTKPVALATVAVQDVYASASNQIINQALAKDIAVEDTLPPLNVRSDARLLTQLLVILLDNAIKYSPDGSTITVGADKKGNTVTLSVNDTGIGIRASDLPHIFDRFYRADHARSGGTGYGLGLSIAQTIADSIHAKLDVSSQVGNGSTFSIRIPSAN